MGSRAKEGHPTRVSVRVNINSYVNDNPTRVPMTSDDTILPRTLVVTVDFTRLSDHCLMINIFSVTPTRLKINCHPFLNAYIFRLHSESCESAESCV